MRRIVIVCLCIMLLPGCRSKTHEQIEQSVLTKDQNLETTSAMIETIDQATEIFVEEIPEDMSFEDALGAVQEGAIAEKKEEIPENTVEDVSSKEETYPTSVVEPEETEPSNNLTEGVLPENDTPIG